ncbi:uncharacterized mitochondrial protein AtMg00810-like [Impatiens glandulifera]|uniref:uncharacterized mitochondrial protein AtMg00810-like n=1 Tax=Impatiens glandulifera TaxID=253017 RepID=UPI001FB0C620|nr:uncharacterized mitochondrial protein AtMg00810-like [Impatiens glandulifera]
MVFFMEIFLRRFISVHHLVQTFQGRIIILLLYVDDMVITSDDASNISDLQTYLHQHFDMKSLGKLRYFLCLKISDTINGIYLSQVKYASDLITRASLTDSKTASTPIEAYCRLTPLDGTLLKFPTLYRQLVDSLIYLTVTHLYIAHAVHIGTLLHGFHFFANSSLVLTGYSDADWAGDPTNRSSISLFHRLPCAVDYRRWLSPRVQQM